MRFDSPVAGERNAPPLALLSRAFQISGDGIDNPQKDRYPSLLIQDGIDEGAVQGYFIIVGSSSQGRAAGDSRQRRGLCALSIDCDLSRLHHRTDPCLLPAFKEGQLG